MMNEVVFAGPPNLMLEAFTPLEDRFLQLGKLIQADSIVGGPRFKLGCFYSFTKLISMTFSSVRAVPFKWALLRENILDNLDYVQCKDHGLLLKLQHAHERKSNKK